MLPNDDLEPVDLRIHRNWRSALVQSVLKDELTLLAMAPVRAREHHLDIEDVIGVVGQVLCALCIDARMSRSDCLAMFHEAAEISYEPSEEGA
jgi:hypothetical protein